MKARTLIDLSLGVDVFRSRRVSASAQLDLRNLTNRAFAYNFSNPFSGTHFGHPRLLSGHLKLVFE